MSLCGHRWGALWRCPVDSSGATSGANQFVSPSWSPQTFITAFGVAIILGIIGGLYPAWRASRLRPVEALRYE
ncbi:MAG: hypothetical protein R3E79_27875 [Caldilineaceae bacterium]